MMGLSKKITLILVLKFLSCRSTPEDIKIQHRVKTKRVRITQKVAQRTLYIHGSLSSSLQSSCLRAINRKRTNKLDAASQNIFDYRLWVQRNYSGYILRLYRGATLLKTSRALSNYELSMAAAAITATRIPD